MDIPFEIPDDVRQFIAHVNEEGPNRYFEYPAMARGKELLQLDRAVWYLRRYCYPMRGTCGPDDAPVDRLPLEIAHVHAFQPEHAYQFRIGGGFLEGMLGRRKDPLRAHLVWKNFFYGARRKRVIRRFTVRMGSATPTHYLKPEIFDDLDRLVRFSEPVRRILRATRRTTPTD